MNSELVLLCFIVGAINGVLGFIIGVLYEARYGSTRGEADQYKEAVMRMIPALRPHYTADYIYHRLILGEPREKEIFPERRAYTPHR